MKAIAKTRPEPGIDIITAPEPTPGPGEVKIQLEAASVCGTDLHIYQWDAWSSERIRPPRIIGHEFCGTVVELGAGVDQRAVGDFVASESHIVPLDSPYLKAGLGHVAPETQIIGVDVDGGFAPYVCIPWSNARPTDRQHVPPRIACFQDALGNAVHTALAGPVEGRDILITGMGPIGLFAVSVCRAAGARRVIVTEVSPYRIELAQAVGADVIIDPSQTDARAELRRLAPEGVDATLEMSGHPSSMALAIESTRFGGRVSMLGVYKEAAQSIQLNEVIFKGLTLQGIVGRRLWETWDQMAALFATGRLILDPVVTHQMHYTEFQRAMELMSAGQAGKVVFSFA